MSAFPEEEALLRAADWLEWEGKWIKGHMGDYAHKGADDDGHCAVGAIMHATRLCLHFEEDEDGLNHQEVTSDSAINRLADAVDPTAAVACHPGAVVAVWNDYRAKSVSEVIDAMRRAAKPENRTPILEEYSRTYRESPGSGVASKS